MGLSASCIPHFLILPCSQPLYRLARVDGLPRQGTPTIADQSRDGCMDGSEVPPLVMLPSDISEVEGALQFKTVAAIEAPKAAVAQW